MKEQVANIRVSTLMTMMIDVMMDFREEIIIQAVMIISSISVLSKMMTMKILARVWCLEIRVNINRVKLVVQGQTHSAP